MFYQYRSYTYHIGTWFLIILVAVITSSPESEKSIYYKFLDAFNYFSIFLGMFYLHYGLLVPKLLLKGRYWQYGLIFPVTVLLYPFLYFALHLIINGFFPEIIDYEPFKLEKYSHYFGQGVFSIIPAIAVRYAVFGRESYYKAQELAHEKTNAELSSLKAQANPHFLFNAFNSLYALSLKKDERLPETILKLSDMMRYMMDYSKKEKAALTDEVKLIEDYLEVQRLRLDNEFEILFEKKGELENKYTTPLILLPLVENCFKHGDLSPESYIRLELDVQGNRMVFQTKNFVEKRHDTTGTGLANLRRLLSLKYGNDFTFVAEPNNGTFYNFLKIPLDEH